jgi:[CysO sulfur-carrier protein]-S-L-cysteine hydrolase
LTVITVKAMTFLISRPILEEIERHAHTALPLECCGLLGGRDFKATSCHPLRNRAARPESEFFAAPEDLFTAMRELREAGEELVAIYHSHPRGPARPSETDVRLAYYPSAVHIIVVPRQPAVFRAFTINNALVRAVELEEVD